MAKLLSCAVEQGTHRHRGPHIDKSHRRSVNEVSPAAKKRHEVMQRSAQAKVHVMDETDSGLDVDALRIVSAASMPTRKKTTVAS